MANGFLMAEICSRYFPAEIQMQSFENGSSMACKADKWDQLDKFLLKKGLELDPQLIEDTKRGLQDTKGTPAAAALIEGMYTKFTQRMLPQMEPSKPETPAPEGVLGNPIGKSPMPARKPAPSARKPVQPTPSKNVPSQGAIGSKPIEKEMPTPPTVVFGEAKVTKIGDATSIRRKRVGR